MSWVLAINPGAGSTKLGLYCGERMASEENLRHREQDLRPDGRILGELPMRLGAVREFLARALPQGERLAAAVGRGGLLAPVPSGTYLVNEGMIADLERAERGEHASNLGPPLARAVAEERGCPAYTVDPVSVDELEPVARLSGLEGLPRRSFTHALNMKAVARRHARQVGRRLEELRLVVAHLGTGVSLSAQRDGRMVEVVNPQDEGPFSGDRCGGVPATGLVEMCFAPGASREAVRRRLFGDGGLYSYLGTRDVREALGRAEAGDAKARLVLDAMTYQISQSVGALATVLEGRADAILLTGGMAHLATLVDAIRRRVAWIAPVVVYPGEDELRALAEGALRVLCGEEAARGYPDVCDG
jgi:butyrate kinase